MARNKDYVILGKQPERTSCKTFKNVIFWLCILLVFSVVILIVVSILTPSCSLNDAPAHYDATKAGMNGWLVFTPINPDGMAAAPIHIEVNSSASVIQSDSKIIVSWSNGIFSPIGTSNSYGLYANNVTLAFRNLNDTLKLQLSLLGWCTNCRIQGPAQNLCSKTAENQWFIYKNNFPLHSQETAEISIVSLSEGNVKLQGVFV